MALQAAQSEETLRQLQRQGDFRAQGIRDAGAAVSQGVRDMSGAYQDRKNREKEEARYQTEEGRAKEAHSANIKQVGVNTAGMELANTGTKNRMEGEAAIPEFYAKQAQSGLDTTAANLAATRAGTAGTYTTIAATKAEQERITQQKASDELDATSGSIASTNAALTAMGPRTRENAAKYDQLQTKLSGLNNYASDLAKKAGLANPALTVRGDKAGVALVSGRKSTAASDAVVAQSLYPTEIARLEKVKEEGIRLASLTNALQEYEKADPITDRTGEDTAFTKILALAGPENEAKLSERGGPFVGSKSSRVKQYIVDQKGRLEQELRQLKAGSYGESGAVIEQRIQNAQQQLDSVNNYLKTGMTADTQSKMQLKLRSLPRTQQVNYQGPAEESLPPLR